MQIFTPDQIGDEIARAREAQDFRPTVAVLATRLQTTELILARAVKEEQGIMWPIQGGVDLYDDGKFEDLGIAGSREFQEETGMGIPPDWIKPLGAIRYETGSRDRFTDGKLIIAMSAGVCENQWNKRRLNPEELAEIGCFTMEAAREQFIRNIVIKPRTAPKALLFSRLLDKVFEDATPSE